MAHFICTNVYWRDNMHADVQSKNRNRIDASDNGSTTTANTMQIMLIPISEIYGERHDNAAVKTPVNFQSNPDSLQNKCRTTDIDRQIWVGPASFPSLLAILFLYHI